MSDRKTDYDVIVVGGGRRVRPQRTKCARWPQSSTVRTGF